MNKIVKIYKAFYNLIKNPKLLNLLIDSEAEMEKYVLKKYNNKVGLNIVKYSDLINKEITIKPFAGLNGGCLITDLAILKSLAIQFKVKDYFEIGTWRGESIANVADIVDNCVTLNLSDEELGKTGNNKKYIELHGFFSKKKKNIQHIYGNSLLKDLSEHFGKYDMVFIDGDHHYEAVLKDTKTAFKLIKNEDSIIVWHDYAKAPESVRWSVLAAILDGAPEDKRKNIFHISNTLCAVYFNAEQYEKTTLVKYQKPSHFFEVKINTKKI